MDNRDVPAGHALPTDLSKPSGVRKESLSYKHPRKIQVALARIDGSTEITTIDTRKKDLTQQEKLLWYLPAELDSVLPPYDRICGVWIPGPQSRCSRDLGCTRHSMEAKRGVVGRSTPFDELWSQMSRVRVFVQSNGGERHEFNLLPEQYRTRLGLLGCVRRKLAKRGSVLADSQWDDFDMVDIYGMVLPDVWDNIILPESVFITPKSTLGPDLVPVEDGTPFVHLHYTISEDRCGSQDDVMAARLAALGTRGRKGRSDNRSPNLRGRQSELDVAAASTDATSRFPNASLALLGRQNGFGSNTVSTEETGRFPNASLALLGRRSGLS